MLQLSATVHDPICLLSSLFVYWRRTRDAQKITKRSPYPPGPIQIRSLYPGQYPINIRSIYLLREDKIPSIQHNTPISSIQIPCISFTCYGGLFRTTTWPSFYRTQSIFSLRELDQFFV